LFNFLVESSLLDFCTTLHSARVLVLGLDVSSWSSLFWFRCWPQAF